MVTMLEARPVARKSSRGGKREGAGRPKAERDDVSVKLDRGIAARAYFVARARGITMAEYLSEITQEQVGKDFDEENERISKGGKA